MLANKSHLLHSITVNYTQLEPFIAHPLLTLPGLLNPFRTLGLSRCQARRRSKRGFSGGILGGRGGGGGGVGLWVLQGTEGVKAPPQTVHTWRDPAVCPLFLSPVNGSGKWNFHGYFLLCCSSFGQFQLPQYLPLLSWSVQLLCGLGLL